MATKVVTVEDLQAFLSDTPEYNLPLNNMYLTPEELQLSIELALDDYNNSPPDSDFIPDLYNFPSKKILLLGAAVEALRMTSHKELRGRMDYNDGGVQNSLYTKTPEYISLQMQTQQEYERLKTRYKRQQNMKACYGGIS